MILAGHSHLAVFVPRSAKHVPLVDSQIGASRLHKPTLTAK